MTNNAQWQKKDIQQCLTILTYAKSKPCQYPSNKYHNGYIYIYVCIYHSISPWSTPTLVAKRRLLYSSVDPPIFQLFKKICMHLPLRTWNLYINGRPSYITHKIHVWYIYRYTWLIFMVNVGINIPYMNHIYKVHLSTSPKKKSGSCFHFLIVQHEWPKSDLGVSCCFEPALGYTWYMIYMHPGPWLLHPTSCWGRTPIRPSLLGTGGGTSCPGRLMSPWISVREAPTFRGPFPVSWWHCLRRHLRKKNWSRMERFPGWI